MSGKYLGIINSMDTSEPYDIFHVKFLNAAGYTDRAAATALFHPVGNEIRNLTPEQVMSRLDNSTRRILHIAKTVQDACFFIKLAWVRSNLAPRVNSYVDSRIPENSEDIRAALQAFYSTRGPLMLHFD